MNKLSLVIVTLLLSSSVVFAGSSSKAGSAGAQELLIPVGARMIGLNGASISTVAGIEAMYWNPAGVSGMTKGTEVTFFKGDGIGDIGINYFAGAASFGDIGVFSIALKSLDFGDIPVTTEDQPSGTGELYSPTFITTTLGYSNALTDRIRVGFAVNVITEKIVRTEATGVAFDAGIQYSNLANINGLSFAVVLKNLGPNMKFEGPDMYRYAEEVGSNKTSATLYGINSAAFELPSQFQIGLSYMTSIDDLNQLNVSGVFEQNNYSNDNFRTALEYSFDGMLFVRGSYLLDQNSESSENLYGMSFGGGLNYDLGFFVLGIDYAYRDSQYFGGLNQIGLTIGL